MVELKGWLNIGVDLKVRELFDPIIILKKKKKNSFIKIILRFLKSIQIKIPLTIFIVLSCYIRILSLN